MIPEHNLPDPGDTISSHRNLDALLSFLGGDSGMSCFRRSLLVGAAVAAAGVEVWDTGSGTDWVMLSTQHICPGTMALLGAFRDTRTGNSFVPQHLCQPGWKHISYNHAKTAWGKTHLHLRSKALSRLRLQGVY